MHRSVSRRIAHVVSLSGLLTGAAAAQVTWIPDDDGLWSVASNWSSNPALPGAADNVVIDVGGMTVRTITLDVNASINSLISAESLLFNQSRVLTLANGGSFAVGSMFQMGTVSRLNVNGGTFSALGDANINGANVFVTNATANLDTVASYVTSTGTNDNRTLQASGAGALLNLSGVETMAGGGFISTLFVNALSSATVDFSGLVTHTGGATQFTANGAGSMIDLSSLESFHNNNGNRNAHLHVLNGGTIELGSLTSMTGSTDNITRLIVDGAASTIDVSTVTTYSNASVQLLNGGQADLSNATSFNGSSLDIRAGVTADLTGVASYTTSTGGNGNRTWRAEGGGSTIDASNVTTAAGGTFISSWFLTAVSGGVIDLSSLQTLTTGATRVSADGAGSLVDLSSLTSWTGTGSNTPATLTATNGGEVRLIGAEGSFLDMHGVSITVTTTGVMDLTPVRQFTTGTLTAQGAAAHTPNINNVNDSNFRANAGGSIALPGLTTTNYLHGGANTERSFIADGAESTLDFSEMTSVTINSGTNPSIRIDALNGGAIDLSNVASINSTPGIINGQRPVRVNANGADSVVDLSSLSVFSDLSSVTNSSLSAVNGGLIRLGDTAFTNVTITVDAASTILGGSLELIGVFTNTTGQTAAQRIDDTRLRGDGLVDANVLNTSGFVTPGATGLGVVGHLTINSDFEQTTNGVFELDIAGLKDGEFDLLTVGADATLGGELRVSLLGGYTPEFGDSWTFLTAAFRDGVFDELIAPTLEGSDLFFDVVYGDTFARLRVVPTPGGSVLFALFAFFFPRRHRLV